MTYHARKALVARLQAFVLGALCMCVLMALTGPSIAMWNHKKEVAQAERDVTNLVEVMQSLRQVEIWTPEAIEALNDAEDLQTIWNANKERIESTCSDAVRVELAAYSSDARRLLRQFVAGAGRKRV